MPLGDDEDEEIDIPLHEIRINTEIQEIVDKTRAIKLRNLLFIGLLCLSILISLVILLLAKPIKLNQEKLSPKPTPKDSNIKQNEWEIEFPRSYSQSQIKLIDIDEDGVDDLIFSISPKDSNNTRSTIYGLNGLDGKILWKFEVKNEIIDFSCEIDIDLDSKLDCLASGTNRTLLAFNPRSSERFWTLNHPYFLINWRIYEPLVLPYDLNDDKVFEIIVAHSNDDSLNGRQNEPGRVILISGKNGHVMGECYQMPFGRGIYHRPVLNRQKDGSYYVFMGSASALHDSGGFYMAPLHKLYFYMMSDFIRLDVDWKNTWNKWFIANENLSISYQKDFLDIYTFYSTNLGGIVDAPLLVDVNNDGTNDVLMSTTHGTLILYDGQTFDQLWTKQKLCYDLHSRPSVAIIDGTVAIIISETNLVTKKTTVEVISGLNGTTLWEFTTNQQINVYPITYNNTFLFSLNGYEVKTNQRIKRHGHEEGKEINEEEDKDPHHCPRLDQNFKTYDTKCNQNDQQLALNILQFKGFKQKEPQILIEIKPKTIIDDTCCKSFNCIYNF